MKNYLEKKEYQRNSSFILVAPTGTGKTTALIEYLRETKEQCIFVSPLNSLAKQVYEKGQGLFQLINCETKQLSILGDIHYALLQGKSIIISLKTFTEYRSMFYNYTIYLDECHLLTDYKDLIKTDSLAEDIRNNKFKKIVGLTATAFGLDKILNLNLIKPDVKPKSIKYIELNVMKQFKLENLVAMILKLYEEKGKLVFLLNNTMALQEIEKELLARMKKVRVYTATYKNIEIIDEHFSEDFDILLCSSSLATGVSIKDDYYAAYVPQSFDSINLIAQFFSRNRNEVVKGCILKRDYNSAIDVEVELLNNEFLGKTIINKTLIDKIFNILTNLNVNSSAGLLKKFIGTSGDYTFSYGKTYNVSCELLEKQEYKEKIDDQKEYFIKYQFPKFNKRKYIYLYKIYGIYDYVFYGKEKDTLLVKYANEYIEKYGHFVFQRDLFYDFCLARIKKYKEDIGIGLAKQATIESLNIDMFEDNFLNKPYKKKVLKDICVNKFAIKEEVFKNQNTIDEFLKSLGYVLKYTDSGKIMRKIKQENI